MGLIVFWLYRALGFGIGLLPLRGAMRTGRMLGWLGYWLVGKYRRIALRNLAIAFPEKPARELRALARRHFATLVGNLFAAEKIARLPPASMLAFATVEGLEHVERAEASKRGFVFVISHIGNWELLAQLSPLVFPTACGTVYQRLANSWMDAHVREVRGRIGLALFERKEGFNAACDLLRKGGGVGVLMDQHAGDSGVWCPFFGRLASTTPLASLLALRTDAVLIPTAMYTDGLGHWRFVIEEPIEPRGQEAPELTAKLNLALEKQIRRQPADWFWVHNRWKTPKPKFLLSTYKRGVVLPKEAENQLDGGAGELFAFAAKQAAAARLQPFRILIRSSNWLGDAVMTVPAVRAIKRGRPDAHVTMLTPAKLADVWRLVPEVDEVIPFDPPRGPLRALRSLFHPWKVARKLRGQEFDAAVVLPNSIRAAFEVWLAGIPRRVGYPGHKGRGFFLDQVLREKKRRKQETAPRPQHQVYHYLRLAEFIGAEIPEMPFALPHERRTPSKCARIAVCPGAEYGGAKRWLPERFAEVIKTLNLARECEWTLVGTFKDRVVAEEIVAQAGAPGNVENRCGQTSLEQLIGILRASDVLLTNDTGTMHLAALLGVPTVSIFGSTEPVLTGPLGSGHAILRHKVECSPCFLRECPIDFRCMKGVEVREVMAAVLGKVGGRGT
jgi:lipopolysaccharide heptosyltransferase II